MAEFFPLFSDYKEFREPFLGGGSVALYITQMYPHLDIWVNDLYEPLYKLGVNLRITQMKLRTSCSNLNKGTLTPASAKYLFLESKEYLSKPLRQTNAKDRAVSFYIVNKCSFSGLTESSSFSKQASDNNP